MALAWVRRLWKKWTRPHPPVVRRRSASFRPRLEILEARTVPSSFMVTDLTDISTDPGYDHSLRYALTHVSVSEESDNYTITFDPLLAGKTIILHSSGDTTRGPSAFLINSHVTIQGDAFRGINIVRDSTAAEAFRLFTVSGSGNLTLENVTLSNGLAQGFDGAGVGELEGGGGGAAGLGGAIFNQGILALQNSTLTENTAKGGNGGNGLAFGYGGGGGGLSGAGHMTYGGAVGGGNASLSAMEGSPGEFGGGGGGGGYPGDAPGFPGGQGGFGGGGGGGGGINLGNAHGGSSYYAGGSGGAGGQNGGGGGGGGGAGLGGALFNHTGATATITNSNFSSNSAQGGSGGRALGSGYGGNGGAGLGGAIFNNSDATLSISNSIFSSNSTQGGLGGTANDPPGLPGMDGPRKGQDVFNHHDSVEISSASAGLDYQYDDSSLHAIGTTVTATLGQPFSGLVATFTADNPYAALTDFPPEHILICWGDGHSSYATQVTQPGGLGTQFQIFGNHTYLPPSPASEEHLPSSITVSITDVDGSTTSCESFIILNKAVPVLTINNSGDHYSATVTGISGIPTDSLEEVAPVLTYYLGAGVAGTKLDSPPLLAGTYTVQATFAGSAHYASAELISIIVPHVISSSTADFPPGGNGVMVTPDGTVSAAIFQPGKHKLPLIVTLEHYGTDPVFGSSTGSSNNPLIIIPIGGTQVLEDAAYDLQVTNPEPGDVVIVRFAIPANNTRPQLLYHNPKNPIQSLQVPESMFMVVNGAFQVTFTDSTPVTIYDLYGTVFTIADVSSVLPVLGSTLSTLQDAGTLQHPGSEDVLGALLISQNVNHGGQLVGVVAPSQTQISLLSSGADADGSDPRFSSRQRQELLRILDTFYREMQHILSPHLHLLMDSLMVSMQNSLIRPIEPQPFLEEPPTPCPTETPPSRDPWIELDTAPVWDDPQGLTAAWGNLGNATQAPCIPSAGSLLLNELPMASLALAAMPLLCCKEPLRERKIDRSTRWPERQP